MVKLSIITVVFNAVDTIEQCIQSLIAQSYSHIEYIVIDGGSTDGTLSVIERYKSHISTFKSEKDRGMYDALNKGIKLSTGDVIGVLHADDVLASKDVLFKVAEAFADDETIAVYGNLNYVDRNNPEKIIRKWRSNTSQPNDVALGWMPAHPTLFLRRMVFEKIGNYSLNHGSAADYEFMLRMLYKHQITTLFLDELIVNMRVGGMSNQSLKHRYQALKNDYLALKDNKVPFPMMALTLKKLRKIKQFF